MKYSNLPATRLMPLPGHAPEDVVVNRDGELVTGVDDGRVLLVHPASGETRILARTGGRPLGLEILPDGRILVCDSPKGLLEIDPATGAVKTLVDSFQGRPLIFCSNVVAARDGTVYFSSSTDRYTVHHWRRDIVENIPTGRLFRRHPSGKVDLLLDRLYFANGLALAPDESWVVVAETGAYRLRRFWLKGPNAGRSEVFAELPGFPDNLSASVDGLIWVAIASPRNAAVGKLHTLPLLIRRFAARLPAALQPTPPRVAWVRALDVNGRVVHDYRWDDGAYAMVTGVVQSGNAVYLSSLVEDALLAFELPGKPADSKEHIAVQGGKNLATGSSGFPK